MMMSFEAVIRLVGGLQETELRHWIAERWVLPESGAEGYVFAEVDVARVQLIHELRYELAIDEEAMPVVLQLLDQVYTLRRRLRVTLEAIDAQPPEIRAAIRARCGAEE
ncbi:MAG TPA: chaperone modulator CbpM [Stellaceae bacterium]|jgi:chaperone modulatory protein CbpM|nr:chaperone modulator CbpM [Stellaceae bacterium]